MIFPVDDSKWSRRPMNSISLSPTHPTCPMSTLSVVDILSQMGVPSPVTITHYMGCSMHVFCIHRIDRTGRQCAGVPVSNSAAWRHEHEYVNTTTRWDNNPLQ